MISYPKIYKEDKNAIKYGRDVMYLEIVINALRSRDLEIISETKSESMSVRGKTLAKIGN